MDDRRGWDQLPEQAQFALLAMVALILAFVLEVSLAPNAFAFVRPLVRLATGAPIGEDSWELLP